MRPQASSRCRLAGRFVHSWDEAVRISAGCIKKTVPWSASLNRDFVRFMVRSELPSWATRPAKRVPVQPHGRVEPAPALAGQVGNVALPGTTHPHPVRVVGTGWPSQRFGATRTAESESVVQGPNEKGCCVRKPWALSTSDAPATHAMAIGLYLSP